MLETSPATQGNETPPEPCAQSSSGGERKHVSYEEVRNIRNWAPKVYEHPRARADRGADRGARQAWVGRIGASPNQDGGDERPRRGEAREPEALEPDSRGPLDRHSIELGARGDLPRERDDWSENGDRKKHGTRATEHRTPAAKRDDTERR